MSQIFPYLAVDQTTGHVAIAWYDPRNDDGGADSMENTEDEAFLAISTDLGVTFPQAPAADAASFPRSTAISHGDYLGVDFHGGIAYVAWADNSNSTGDNPDHLGNPEAHCLSDGVPCMDIYVPEPGSAMQLMAGTAAVLGLASRRSRRRR